MGDEATTVTSPERPPLRDDEDAERKPDKQRNPVRRAHLYAKFVDGKWWTPAGMAAALGSDLANDLAVRYYRYKTTGPLESRPVGEVLQAARKKCVQDVLAGIPATLAETKEEDGQVFYRLKQPTTVRVSKDVKPKVQSAPAATDTGLTTAGVLAAITELGGSCDLEALVEKLKPAMVSDEKLIAWAKKAAGNRGRGRNPQDPSIEEARRAAVITMCERARASHEVKIIRTVTIEYSPPREEGESSTQPAEPADDSTRPQQE